MTKIVPARNFHSINQELNNFAVLITKTYKTEELKKLRNAYSPKMDKKYFDLKKPKLDRQMKRRLKRVKSNEASRAQAREKNLSNVQYKVLDVIRPLSYSWALIFLGSGNEEHPLYSAVVC